MNHAEIRQQRQLEFVNSHEDIVVGNIHELPISLEKLKVIDRNSDCVVRYINGGLTSEVFKLEIDGKFYTLKKKRKEALVRNIDGQTSFLNEVQRRQDFAIAKRDNPDGLESVIDTIYAGFKDEIIFSPWVEGDEVSGYNQELLDNLFFTLFNMEKSDVFECDLCSGNILVRPSNKVKFFDFGYAYKFNPLTEFNSDGKDRPEFHMAERFETRTFMQHLCDIEEGVGKDKSLELYTLEKEIVLKYYAMKKEWLQENNADIEVVEHIAYFINLWQDSLKTMAGIKKLYSLDQFRSFLLDLEDDVRGKSCNSDTIIKGKKVVQALVNDYDFLKENNIFIPEDNGLSQQELVDKYNHCLGLAEKYQLDDVSAFNEWKANRMQRIRVFYSSNL